MKRTYKSAAGILAEMYPDELGLGGLDHEKVIDIMKIYTSQKLDECMSKSYKTILGNDVVNVDSILSLKKDLA